MALLHLNGKSIEIQNFSFSELIDISAEEITNSLYSNLREITMYGNTSNFKFMNEPDVIKPQIYTPEELGIPWPEVLAFSLDACGAVGDIHNDSHVGIDIGAHAHCCPKDKYYGMICIPEKLLRDKQGNLTYVAFHEYGHILTDYSDYFKYVIECNSSSVHTMLVSAPINNYFEAHNANWKKTMTRLGYPKAHGRSKWNSDGEVFDKYERGVVD